MQVTVEDAVKDDNDAVAVYVDSANSGKDDITPVTVTVKRSEAAEVENGYQATIKVPLSGLSVAKVIGMDVVVTNGDKTAKSGNSSGKNGSGETAKQERKAQEQPSVWQDTAETTGKEKTEGGEETEEKTGGPLLPGFIILCIVLLLTGSICLIRDNNIDLKK